MGTPTRPRWLQGGELANGGQWILCHCGRRQHLPGLDDWDGYVAALRAFTREHWECRDSLLRAFGATA